MARYIGSNMRPYNTPLVHYRHIPEDHAEGDGDSNSEHTAGCIAHYETDTGLPECAGQVAQIYYEGVMLLE